MLSAYVNSMKIPELRKKILFTLGIIALIRVASNIPCPGVDAAKLQQIFDNLTKSQGGSGLMGMISIFSGGAMEQFAVAALGIMPYISASIIMQMMTPVIPQLEKLSREGETGRQKITQYTRYMTLVICLIQGVIYAKTMVSGLGGSGESPVINPGPAFYFQTVIILTAGTMLFMWLGEQVTERGIGNGASIIITVNIVASLPSAISQIYQKAVAGATGGGDPFGPIHIVLLILFFFVICGATIALIQGHRKVPIRHARKAVGGRTQAGAGPTTYMPLRVNYSGVMPVIFANAVLMFPMLILGSNWVNQKVPFLGKLAPYFTPGSTSYMVLFGLAILIFSFFWVANQFNPIQIADNLQKGNAYIPGIKPGHPTAEFLDHSMTRITVAGAAFLIGLALIPMIFSIALEIPQAVTRFFGGTSLLIMAGVMLDTMRQVEAHLLSKRYDGFLSKGQLKSRRGQ